MSLLCKYRRGWHSTFRLLKPTFPMRNKTKVEQVCQKIIRISSLKCTIWSSNHRYNLGHHPSCKGVYIYMCVWPALELWNHPTNYLPAYNCCSCHKVLLAIPNVLGWFHHHWFADVGTKGPAQLLISRIWYQTIQFQRIPKKNCSWSLFGSLSLQFCSYSQSSPGHTWGVPRCFRCLPSVVPWA